MDNDILQRNVAKLSQLLEAEARMLPDNDAPLPSVQVLGEVVELVKMVVFPAFFDKRQTNHDMRSYHIGVNMERLGMLLEQQLELALLFCDGHCDDAPAEAEHLAEKFIDELPNLKMMLYTDVEAIFGDDPSVRTHSEVIFSYPSIQAMLHYRIAHTLYLMGVPVIPRVITERAHAKTGIDIHPGARIGEYFSIAHGTGVVVGETCVIGNHVTLYQGVTLGSKNYRLANGGERLPLDENVKRHPTLEDNVTVYSNSTLLGSIQIGHHTVVGGNIWLTHSVPPFSMLLQGKAQDVTFTGGLGI